MSARVTIVDYGMGNLFSVRRAFEVCGAEVTFAEEASGVNSAERLVLPGVGAFGDGMLGLRDRGLLDPIQNFAKSGRPLIGICLGMQMLLSESAEFGRQEGLGIIPGQVVAIPATGTDGKPHKIPHIGWNTLVHPDGLISWKDSILVNTEPGEAVYLVHSFTAVPKSAGHRLADCDYDGRQISAAVRSGNVYGCQFHPERSGQVGLRIIGSFLSLPA
jgi:glutamine amidotransferase